LVIDVYDDEQSHSALALLCLSSPPLFITASIFLPYHLPLHSQETNMAEVRQRAKAADPTVAPSEPPSAKPIKATKKGSGFGVTDVLRILGGILLLNCALSYFVTSSSLTWGWRPWYSKPGVVASWLVRCLASTPLPLVRSTTDKTHENRKDQST
jgi:hypothetical protein